MIKIGEYNTLEILRLTSVGLFLGDEEGNDILLPNKYVPETYELGNKLTVFCYLDHDERPVASSLTPKITLNDFGLLQAVEVNEIGAFLDWGLEKHLFVPYREQARKMETGKWYLVYLYMDDETDRLVASSKTNNFISNEELTVNRFDEVDLIVSRHTEMGAEVIINQKHKGLVYENEIFTELHLGDRLKGVIKKVREDNKIDVSLQQIGYKNIEPTAERILHELERNNGFLGLHDKSDADLVREMLGMSKKSFKKAVGSLYKQKLILIKDDGIYLKK
ncbi:S1-like domain-containing RNA-binding protein [Zhouia spongiae]|uniref:S1-like domain-containing RNA-binding protein n=1 Tax=Zhouia spongiae TaxID=2202721 RepID=A0ABY3YS01_9FLAO|nr:S1-like domain-containing RNA-binding protein [Zhouia spongiae]UNZ00490.1 S1-like domain-containing RNA-binding protein [Zhouia spongiae]